ncbi:hypothetical protein TNCV_1153971 [Trichonephila clavipes]|nr:hypothetical protein TNCV_1153971 [Trichonephila clavipes]
MSSFLVLCEGDTKNRWRDGQVCPDVRQGTMAPWSRRLGRERGDRKGTKKTRETRGEMEKRAESGIGMKKTMNAGGVENGI